MKKILFVTSEAHPLIKTGGLADVSGSLPKALADLSQDVRMIIPKYQALKTHGENIRYLCSLRIDNRSINILETSIPDSKVIVWLIDYPGFYNYPGNPYVDEKGEPWPNNAERFALFCRVAVEIAMNRVNQDWKPDIVHCNDWQSGLVPALLSLEYDRPATVFTIHNMAYQGLFPPAAAAALNLPGQLVHPEGLEFHSLISFIKGGLVYSDRITTVSPTYALEIQTPDFGYGLEGLLAHRKDFLSGIINGIDVDQWNPETDPYIAQHYKPASLNQKMFNKSELQRRLELPVNDHVPLFALIGRLVEQKGIDLLLDCLPEMVDLPMQFILLGSGDKEFEKKLTNFAHLYPDKIAINIGYDEPMAHLIEAGADIFLMPSRFEPCGLNQMYSQRYGTIPIVRRTGGLADTVVDSLPHTVADSSATGIIFNEASAGSLMEAIKRAMILYANHDIWKKIQLSGMKRDFSWQQSAEQYLALYQSL
ncbi:MAG: glycogen synthase GlgA [Gammaproteobacteria bacterium]